MSTKTVLAFDAYGTLLSTSSIAESLAGYVGKDNAQAIATEWRRLQLEYTFRLTSMSQYEPFSAVTLRSLKHALAINNAHLGSSAIDSVMHAYDTLGIFPDVAPGLKALQSHSSTLHAVVFSNGTHDMVHSSIHKSPELSPYAGVFADIVTVEEVKKFKPSKEVYWHLAEKAGKSKSEMGDMWLVSGNPFDVVGAKAVGMRACWVDREGKGWVDALVEGSVGRPDVIVRGVDGVVDAVLGFRG